MATNVRFISTDRLKSNTPIQQNVDDDLLKPYISKAQDTHVHQYLGTDLYNALKTKVINNTLAGDYLALMEDYIQPVLVEWAFYEVLPFVSLKITNKSIGRGNADYLSEADLNDLKYLRQTVMDIARFQGERLIGYLKENSSLFPEYQTNSGLDKIQPQYSQNFFGGIYTGKSINECGFGLGDKWIDLY
jgi:hypothetical protein